MTPDYLLCFAHGKESGPWGTKITRLAQIAHRRGFEVISPDYSHTHDPRVRVAELLERAPQARRALVLAGSSMGGYVSAMACAALRPTALFLIAPALYFPGFDEEPPAPPVHTTVVHGWSDDIVPVERAIRYAQRHQARLHLLDGGHTLNDRLPALEGLLDELLQRALFDAAYRAAEYVVPIANDEIVIRVDCADAASDRRLIGDCGIDTHWAIVSACNPASQALSAAENSVRAASLRQQLDAAGIRHYPALGRDPDAKWPAETSELLCDPPADFAELAARNFGQNAVVCGELGKAPRLVWLT